MNKVKNVLVTGGLGGIGLNICKLFIKKNHNLVIVIIFLKNIFLKDYLIIQLLIKKIQFYIRKLI